MVQRWAKPVMLVSEPASPDNVATPAANTNAAVVYAGVSDKAQVISGMAYSYQGGTPTGNLQVLDGEDVVFEQDIVAAGPGQVYFDPPLRGSERASLQVVLAAGGEGITGKLSVLGHWQE